MARRRRTFCGCSVARGHETVILADLNEDLPPDDRNATSCEIAPDFVDDIIGARFDQANRPDLHGMYDAALFREAESRTCPEADHHVAATDQLFLGVGWEPHGEIALGESDVRHCKFLLHRNLPSRSPRPYSSKCTPGAVAERILDLDELTFDSRDCAHAAPVPDDQLIEK
jgi:hypothetical protein